MSASGAQDVQVLRRRHFVFPFVFPLLI